MMGKENSTKARFLRRTVLGPDEYRTNFRQIDCEVIEAITSEEASRITPQMSRIYLRLIQAPSQFWEREGVLRFSGKEKDGDWMTAWEQLLSITGVASATARKSIAWMSEKGIIGYFAGKNGVGIRIFINRAAASIRERPRREEKKLRVGRTSSSEPHTSKGEAPFKESFANRENLEVDIIPHAQMRGGEKKELGVVEERGNEPPTVKSFAQVQNETAVVEQIIRQIAPQLRVTAEREHERTRQWFVDHALPKAIRVAQRSAYDILRANDAISQTAGVQRRARSDNSRVGANPTPQVFSPRPLTEREIDDLAQGCAAIFYAQGRGLDQTLSAMASADGRGLSAEAIRQVRARAEVLITTSGD